VVISGLGAFVGVAAVLIVTPGPDTALTIRNSLLGGWRAGLCTGGGAVTGQAVWALATSTGMAALLQSSRPAFLAIRMAGAAYLLCLGMHSLGEAARPRGEGENEGESGRSRRLPPDAAYRQGVLSNLSNPKMAVFFISLLPQFANSSGSPFAAMLALGLVLCSMTFVWLAAYAATVARVGDLLRQQRARRLLDGCSGAALVGLGLRLATEPTVGRR
jgi:threonine/homoserine/homoserine lactone efflux protein